MKRMYLSVAVCDPSVAVCILWADCGLSAAGSCHTVCAHRSAAVPPSRTASIHTFTIFFIFLQTLPDQFLQMFSHTFISFFREMDIVAAIQSLADCSLIIEEPLRRIHVRHLLAELPAGNSCSSRSGCATADSACGRPKYRPIPSNLRPAPGPSPPFPVSR